MDDTTPPERTDRRLDTEALKGLAHPLRVELLDRLSTYGPATASGLAEALGESSGATSYHLRQLAKSGFVREVEGRGTGRERWWERVPGGITVATLDFEPGTAAYSASSLVGRAFERNRAAHLQAFVEAGADVLPLSWSRASMSTTVNVRLDLDEFTEMSLRLEAAVSAIVEEYRGRTAPASRPIQVHLNSFPIVDGLPLDDPSGSESGSGSRAGGSR